MNRLRRVAGILLAAVLAVGCPPPPDVGPSAEPATPGSAGGTGAPHAGDEGTAAERGGEPAEPSAQGDRAAPGGARPVAYERMPMGGFTARCPSCGEVQKERADRCGGCGQTLSSWRHETPCAPCAGEGRCESCGDDRACLACDGAGKCPFCDGKGAAGKAKCGECGGGGSCDVCRGDGRRESVKGDFLPDESYLPGVCPTCVDASGLCPECGSGAKDRAGNPCGTCAGRGVCPDCGGLGACTHCPGDGICEGCAGSGRSVRNGTPRRAAERPRTLRMASGSSFGPAVIVERPAETIVLEAAEGRDRTRTTLQRAQVHALSVWLALRDFPPEDDGRTPVEPARRGEHWNTLATVAAEARFWPLAQSSLQRVRAVDPRRGPDVDARLREIEALRLKDWGARAESALKAGDVARGTRLLEMIAFQGRGTAEGKRAEMSILFARKSRDDAAAAGGDAERLRAAEQGRAAAARAVERFGARMERARTLLERAETASSSDPLRERTYARAEHAARAARRIVQAAASREPPGTSEWTADPATLAQMSRSLESSVAAARAGRAVEGGRYGDGERCALRALALDPQNELAAQLRDAAKLGLARRGVLEGSPPPEKR